MGGIKVKEGSDRIVRYCTGKSTLAIWGVIAVCILIQFGCTPGPTEPESKKPREYTWTIDTLSYPGSFQTLMLSVWGSSPKNVYAAGHNWSAYGFVYHYDGSSWQPVSTPFRILSLTGVFGFGANDVWVVGQKDVYPDPSRSAVVVRYNGSRWYEMSAGNVSMLESIWGSSSSDVWMGGLDGTLLHYDGMSITPDSAMMTLARSIDPASQFFSGASSTPNETYAALLAAIPGSNGYRCHIFRRHNSTWSRVDSTYGQTISCLWSAPWGKMYRGTTGVDVLQDGTWNRLFYAPAIYRICGVAEDNFFAIGSSIYHWNGKDLFEFKDLHIQGIELSDVWTDGTEVFIVGNDYKNTVVYHGR